MQNTRTIPIGTLKSLVNSGQTIRLSRHDNSKEADSRRILRIDISMTQGQDRPVRPGGLDQRQAGWSRADGAGIYGQPPPALGFRSSVDMIHFGTYSQPTTILLKPTHKICMRPHALRQTVPHCQIWRRPSRPSRCMASDGIADLFTFCADDMAATLRCLHSMAVPSPCSMVSRGGVTRPAWRSSPYSPPGSLAPHLAGLLEWAEEFLKRAAAADGARAGRPAPFHCVYDSALPSAPGQRNPNPDRYPLFRPPPASSGLHTDARTGVQVDPNPYK